MLLGFKSRNTTTAFLAGIALVVVGIGGWAYQYGFGRFSSLIVLGKYTDQEIAAILFQYRNSISLFLLAIFLLLAAVAGAALSAERARKRSMKELVHWMRHRGCPVDENHELTLNDEGMKELVKMVEALFPDTPSAEGRTLTRKEELEEFKSRFLELITHQLQTPLTSIRWNIEALLSEDLGALNNKQKDLLQVTDKNYEGILTMIGDWIEALDVERGFLRMNIEAVDLERYIDLVIEDNRNQAETKELEIVKKVSRGLPAVRADKSKLLFVLKKLLHNAVTYTPEKGKVEVRARKTGDYVRVEVQDSGVGIPYEEQQWIFKKFFRASNATLIEPNASGVGLFVAKTLVEAFGGQIAFDSVEGQGTTFIFTVPIAGPTEGATRSGALVPVKSVRKTVKTRSKKKAAAKPATALNRGMSVAKKAAKKKPSGGKKSKKPKRKTAARAKPKGKKSA